MTARHKPMHEFDVVVDDRPLGATQSAGSRHVGAAPGDELTQLHRRLLAPTDRGHGSAEEAMRLLEPVRQQPAHAVTTALLVVTHPRFEHCSRTLVHRLAAGGLLDPALLDELADVLLREPRVTFAVPASWLGATLVLPAGTRLRARGHRIAAPADRHDATGQLLPLFRRSPAAARRWAATRLLAAGHLDVEAVLARAQEVDDSAGGALVCGALDAWASLPPSALEQALAVALGWPRGAVRRRALDVLDASGRPDEARARAAGDGDARVRTWQPAAQRAERASGQQALFEP